MPGVLLLPQTIKYITTVKCFIIQQPQYVCKEAVGLILTMYQHI